MADVFTDVVAGDGEYDGVVTPLQQVHQGTEQLLAALVQTSSVLAPELS